MIAPIKALFGQKNNGETSATSKKLTPVNTILETQFPTGYHVFSFFPGPTKSDEVIVGGGDPLSGLGALFIGQKEGHFKTVELPDETAFLTCYHRLPNRKYVAGGMSTIGRGAILLGNESATEWKSVDLDLHPYSTIAFIANAPDGSLLASTGQMITQGKTKPVLFRSTDEGKSWTKEEQKLPVSLFQSYDFAPDGTMYIGTCGDHTPVLYRSKDGARTFENMPDFPGYKTYKMLSVKWLVVDGKPKLFVVLWGYKTEIADRVVRIYVSNDTFTGWNELPPIEESHFIFSILYTKDRSIYVGSEKGKIFKSTDLGQSWNLVTQFSTNIGAYALYEEPDGTIWVGKDFVSPDDYSLWRIK